MRDILLICMLAIFLIIGYYQMHKVDKVLEHIKQPKHILIIFDKDYDYMQDFENEETVCMRKNEFCHFSQQFTAIIICTIDDYYNLLMNYHIQKQIKKCHVYAICHDREYLNLYRNEHIHVLQTKEDIKGLMVKLYEKNMETTHKC